MSHQSMPVWLIDCFASSSSIKIALQDLLQNPKSALHLNHLLDNCTRSFENEDRYRNDIRFLKVWILHVWNWNWNLFHSVVCLFLVFFLQLICSCSNDFENFRRMRLKILKEFLGCWRRRRYVSAIRCCTSPTPRFLKLKGNWLRHMRSINWEFPGYISAYYNLLDSWF